jgi:hypothetical protein
LPNVPVDDDAMAACILCREKFIKFWDQEQEEWMYRDAVIMNQQIYHSGCYKDLASQEVTISITCIWVYGSHNNRSSDIV